MQDLLAFIYCGPAFTNNLIRPQSYLLTFNFTFQISFNVFIFRSPFYDSPRQCRIQGFERGLSFCFAVLLPFLFCPRSNKLKALSTDPHPTGSVATPTPKQ